MANLKTTAIAYEITQRVLPSSITYAATLTLDLSQRNNFVIGTLTGNLTLTLSNPLTGSGGFIVLTQDATGARTLTIAGSNGRKFTGESLTLSTAANTKDILYWDCHDGTTVNLVLRKGVTTL